MPSFSAQDISSHGEPIFKNLPISRIRFRDNLLKVHKSTLCTVHMYLHMRKKYLKEEHPYDYFLSNRGSLPLGVNVFSVGQLHHWGPTSPLGANFTTGCQLHHRGSYFAPRGEIETGQCGSCSPPKMKAAFHFKSSLASGNVSTKKRTTYLEY
jgi:hypothetical protein